MTQSPWHAGEIAIQSRVGVAERMAKFGSQVIRPYMLEQHRVFYEQLPFMLIAAVDEADAPWASILEGLPGFARSPSPTVLQLNTELSATDPIHSGLQVGSAVGLLGIELHTRRRNRLNGLICQAEDNHLSIEVEHSFGNCPQYIQTRDFSFARKPSEPYHREVTRLSSLDDNARRLIENADTFFVASYVDLSDGRRQVDVSHRGGQRGFVRVMDNRLSIPDFAGNLHFNTLGNLLVNPKAGLLFIDFESGDVLQVTGVTTIQFDGFEVESFQGAERLWHIEIKQVVFRRGLLKLRWQFSEFSPNSLITGSWSEAAAHLSAQALQQTWRPYRVTRVEKESSSINSFYLAPDDGHVAPLYQAGQHLPIRVTLNQGDLPVIRQYSISSAPSDAAIRISVRRDGLVSSYLHRHIKVGDVIEAHSPTGSFVIDSRIKRPVVLISAGVGITPMMAFLHYLVFEGFRTRSMRQTYFIHCARNHQERGFYDELQLLQKTAGGALVQFHALTQPDLERIDSHDLRQRINITVLKHLLPWDDYDFYLCGPAAFTQNIYEQLREHQVADQRIFAESFGPSSLHRQFDIVNTPVVLPAVSTESVKVLFARSDKEVLWETDSGYLLALAESQGLQPDFSCRVGSCGTCRTKIIEGAVTYLAPPIAVLASDEALICCAVPATGTKDLILAL